MKNCRTIYPLKIVRPLNKHKLDYKPLLLAILNSLHENGCPLFAFIADNPKRAIIREALNHASNYGCEYCNSKAVQYSHGKAMSSEEKKEMELRIKHLEKKQKKLLQSASSTAGLKKKEDELKLLDDLIKELKNNLVQINKKHAHSVWPASTSQGEPRTREGILETLEKLESNNRSQLSADDVKGIVGKSLLLDVEGFDFVNDIPVEYMHVGCLGVVKRMLELTFLVGENRVRVSTRRLTHPSVFNEFMKDIKTTREFSRRARELDFAVLKAQEMRNIILFMFPVVVQCIEPEAKERRLWLLLAFMFRSCIVPENEFCHINVSEISLASSQFYILFEKLFSPKNCTYSIHTFISHLLQIRSKGPLTETSAFAFENFYGQMRKSFVPGTNSTLKQILEKVYMKRFLTYHCCKKTIYFSPHDTALENNSMIYVFDNGNYNMYKIVSINRDEPDIFHCNIQGKIAIEFDEASDLDWSSIGVFKEGATGDEEVLIERKNVNGKVLKICSLLITCPINILHEQ